MQYCSVPGFWYCAWQVNSMALQWKRAISCAVPALTRSAGKCLKIQTFDDISSREATVHINTLSRQIDHLPACCVPCLLIQVKWMSLLIAKWQHSNENWCRVKLPQPWNRWALNSFVAQSSKLSDMNATEEPAQHWMLTKDKQAHHRLWVGAWFAAVKNVHHWVTTMPSVNADKL